MATIHYLDIGEYYSIYGALTLIVVILLLWYFIRTNLTSGECKHSHHKEGLNNPDGDLNGDFQVLGLSGVTTPIPATKLTPDGEEPAYHLDSGTYGDIPVVFFKDSDLIYSREWGMGNYLYLPNTRTMFENVNTPIQKAYWDNTDQYIGVEVDGLTHLTKVQPGSVYSTE